MDAFDLATIFVIHPIALLLSGSGGFVLSRSAGVPIVFGAGESAQGQHKVFYFRSALEA
jgi:hypothetical protein